MDCPVLATVITQSQMHVATNNAFASTSTRFNPYFGWYNIYIQNIPAKVGIKPCILNTGIHSQ